VILKDIIVGFCIGAHTLICASEALFYIQQNQAELAFSFTLLFLVGVRGAIDFKKSIASRSALALCKEGSCTKHA
jgi:hypothetical protein